MYRHKKKKIFITEEVYKKLNFIQRMNYFYDGSYVSDNSSSDKFFKIGQKGIEKNI